MPSQQTLLTPKSQSGSTTPRPAYPTLEAAQAAVTNCTLCPLHSTRTHTVFSDGNPQARLLLIGEGPGQQEDEQGIPFVGRAGQLLTQMLNSVGINRATDIYICNTVKCRPPQNRKPLPSEMATCRPYLDTQIALIQPRYILLAGASAYEAVFHKKAPITKIRGQWLAHPNWPTIQFMPILHPSYLLRNPSLAENTPKWHTWQDMLTVKAALDERT